MTTPGALDPLLAHLLARLADVEALNAHLLASAPARLALMRAAQEQVTMAADNLESVTERVEADAAADVAQRVLIHTHVAELRALVAELSAAAAAQQVVTADQVARLSTAATTIEAAVTSDTSDTSEPPPPPPAPAP